MNVVIEDKLKKEEVYEQVQAAFNKVISYKQTLFDEKRSEIRRLMEAAKESAKSEVEQEQVPQVVNEGEKRDEGQQEEAMTAEDAEKHT
jgi:septum formation inhibitor-activating ATPase MinD